MAKLTDFIRPDCSNCGMAMIVIAGFELSGQKPKSFECLRCGFVDPPVNTLPIQRADDFVGKPAAKRLGQA